MTGIALLTGNLGYPQVDQDIFEYHRWAQLLFGGHLPWRGFMVEYPPGVFPAMVLPGSKAVYELEFIVIAFAVDSVVTHMLQRRGKSLGVWCWCLLPIAIGPVMWVRFDIFLAALIVGFVLFVSEQRWRAAAVCVAGATLIKLWPVMLVGFGWFYLARAHRQRFLAWAAAGIAAPILAVIAVGGINGLLRMLSYQSGRGLEVESLWAVPFAVAHSVLAGPSPVPGHGSGEYPVTGFASAMIDAAMPVALLLFAAAWWARWRKYTPISLPHALLGLIAVLLATSKVLSAQYALWAAAAVVVLLDDLPRHQRRRLMLATVLYLGATQFLFPWAWWDLSINDTRGVAATVLHCELLLLWLFVALTTIFKTEPRRRRTVATLPILPSEPTLVGT